MKCLYLFFIGILSSSIFLYGQEESPCDHTTILNRHLLHNPDAFSEIEQNENFTQDFISAYYLNAQDRSFDTSAHYIIPVVLHVFHNGDDGKISLEQAQSGLDVLNRDMQGLNPDWDEVSEIFEPIKSSLDIQFCLASIDPDGNPTTGVIYHQDSLGMLNESPLTIHAWNNFNYLNIYLPKYTSGEPSLFTAYAYYPDLSLVETNGDGIFYSSIRWGYGEHSELEDEQEWASVITHEVGHWLNLRHTFENGCEFPGDLVDDTPYTLGGTIELSGCNNYDESCDVTVNGENYMDYNHDCKRMFTQGQVDRMTAALHLDSRINLWSNSNLVRTGCKPDVSLIEEAQNDLLSFYPNPTSQFVHFNFRKVPDRFILYSIPGKKVMERFPQSETETMDLSFLEKGVYFFQVDFNGSFKNGTIIIE